MDEQIKEQTWTFVDKSAWARGEWDGEPDKVQWIDPITGLDCLIHRGPAGALCGYVGVTPGSKFHGMDYNAVYQWDDDESGSSFPEVHGGLTFSDFCAKEPRADGSGICHIAEPGRTDNVWWRGFDCAHSGDLCPRYDKDDLSSFGSYRDLGYVKREVAYLDKQIAERS